MSDLKQLIRELLAQEIRNAVSETVREVIASELKPSATVDGINRERASEGLPPVLQSTRRPNYRSHCSPHVLVSYTGAHVNVGMGTDSGKVLDAFITLYGHNAKKRSDIITDMVNVLLLPNTERGRAKVSGCISLLVARGALQYHVDKVSSVGAHAIGEAYRT